MKKGIRIFSLASILISATIVTGQTGNYYGLWWDGSTEYFASINPYTSQKTILNTLPEVKLVAAFNSAFATGSNRYVFIGGPTTSSMSYYVIDAATGAVISQNPRNEKIDNIAYSPADRAFYGLWWDGSTEYFVSIDPYTSTKRIIASIPGVTLIEATSSAFTTDCNNLYVFVGGTSGSTMFYYMIDATTGAVVSKSSLSEAVRNIAYSPTDDAFYGLWWDGSAEYFVSIDPYTSTKRIIASIPGVTTIAAGNSAFDFNSNRYVFDGGAIGGTRSYYVINATSGEMISQTSRSDNIINIQYGGSSPTARPPVPPKGLSCSPGKAHVAVSWRASGSNGGSAIMGYTVTSYPEGKTCATTGDLTCTVMGLSAGRAYAFTVTATNAVGTSAASELSPVVTTEAHQLKKVMIINESGSGGYVHTNQINYTSNYINAVLGPKYGFTCTIPANQAAIDAVFRDDSLSTYDVVVFNGGTRIGGSGAIGDTGAQHAFQRWLKHGGGLVGLTGLMDHNNTWLWLRDSVLSGTIFTQHSNWGSDPNAKVQWDTLQTNGVLKSIKPEYDSLRACYPTLHTNFTYPDEWYSYSVNPRTNADILLTVDENTYTVPSGAAMGPGHPVAWAYHLPPDPSGNVGRFIYSSRGHELGAWDGTSSNHAPIDSAHGAVVANGVVYSDTSKTLMTKGFLWQSIRWAAGLMIRPASVPGAPSLISPLPDATGIPISTTLTWWVSSGATSYHVQLSLDPTFATTLVNDSTVTGTSRAVGPLANNTTYYWRVNARNDSGTSPWSNVWKFTTEARKPQLVAPTNGKIVPDTATLTWLSYAASTSYHVQVAIDSSFSLVIMNDSNLTDTSRSIGPLPRNVTYYWRVNASSTEGTSPWSDVWKFKVQPLIPQLVSPAQNAQNVPTSTTLTWLKFADSTTYHLQLAIDSLFVYTVIDDSTLTVTSKATGLLPGSVTYYWHVSARNALDTTVWSETWNFTTSVTGISQKGFSLQSLNLAKGGGILRFSLAQRARVRIQLFNVKGQRVLQLLDETRDAGYYNLPLSKEAKGSYFLDFRAGDFHKTIPIQP